MNLLKYNGKNIILFIISTALILSLCACKIATPLKEDSIDQVLYDGLDAKSIKASGGKKSKPLTSAYKDLMPEINIPNLNNTGAVSATGDDDESQRFDITVNNVPAKKFFMGLVKGTKYNVTLSPLVAGDISLDLKNVSVPQAMEAVRNIYGFEYERVSYGYQIFPRRLETRIFNVNYLNIDRGGQSKTAIGSGPITNNTQTTLTQSGANTSQQVGSMPSGIINTSINSNFWTLLKQNLLAIINQTDAPNTPPISGNGSNEATATTPPQAATTTANKEHDGRSIVINPGSGTIIAKAYPEELRSIAQYLDSIQDIMQRQVIIEAKIIEVTLNASYQSGINWKILGLQQGINDSNLVSIDGANGDADGFSFPSGDFQLLTDAMLNLKITDGNAFNSVIKLLSTQGNVKVLSNPRISTLNNQKAVIKVGGDKFFVTNVGSNVNSSGGGAVTSSGITLTPFFSGISLDVTPQIDEEGYISMHIHPIISLVTKDTMDLTVNNQTQQLPLAQSSVRETDSVVRAKSGQVIIIGGLMDDYSTDMQISTPGADRVPLAGELFKNKNKSTLKHELIILLRPNVIGGVDGWQKQLKARADSLRKFKKAESVFSYNIVSAKQKNR